MLDARSTDFDSSWCSQELFIDARRFRKSAEHHRSPALDLMVFLPPFCLSSAAEAVNTAVIVTINAHNR
jgi:hypothetical protein